MNDFTHALLVDLLCAVLHPVEALGHDGEDVPLGRHGLHDEVLEALDALLVQVLQVLEHRGELLRVVLALQGKSGRLFQEDNDKFGSYNSTEPNGNDLL